MPHGNVELLVTSLLAMILNLIFNISYLKTLIIKGFRACADQGGIIWLQMERTTAPA